MCGNTPTQRLPSPPRRYLPQSTTSFTPAAVPPPVNDCLHPRGGTSPSQRLLSPLRRYLPQSTTAFNPAAVPPPVNDCLHPRGGTSPSQRLPSPPRRYLPLSTTAFTPAAVPPPLNDCLQPAAVPPPLNDCFHPRGGTSPTQRLFSLRGGTSPTQRLPSPPQRYLAHTTTAFTPAAVPPPLNDCLEAVVEWGEGRDSIPVRRPDSQSREPGFKSHCGRFEPLASLITPRCHSSLSCITEYLAIQTVVDM